MNITLVAIHPQRSPQAVPLACAFLKEALLADPEVSGAVRVEIAEFFLEDSPGECAEAILKTAPDLVAFSIYVWSRDHALSIAQRLVRIAPALTLCAGGAEPTANPAGLLDSGVFRFLVRGEGELPFVQAVRLALRGAGPAGVPGVLMPGELPGALPVPAEIDSIPSPYLSGLLDPALPGGALWQLSRGCDFACAFCFDHKGAGGVRRFALARIEAELRLFARLRVPQVFVLDSTFNKLPKRAKEILRLIGRLAPQVHFHFEVRSEFIDAEMAELFASVTCSLQIGLQSADPGVLRAVGRGFDPDDFSYRVSLLNRHGAIFGFDLIYGLPGDSLSLFRSSLDFALSLYPNHLDIFPLAVLPGTRLYAKADALGLKHLPSPPYTLLSTPDFTAGELEEARLLAAACDIFYSRGKAVAWFNATLAALKLSPAAFLSAFSRFLGSRSALGEQEIAEQEIWGLQRQFLSEIFRDRKKSRLLPLALDLADYHHHYACALLATPPVPPAPRELKGIDLLQRPLQLAPSAALARFNYEILDILEAGDMELPAFASCFKPAQSYAVIYPAAGEVCTESVSRPYFELLLALDGKRTALALCRDLGLPGAELLPFLEFALSEGIVTLSRPA
ncbi:MAG: B12-binding domain-containing radical SAM protein [Geobacteraceae bacterium GWC2_58_44]|nr:MAG: B12-binding domain-containing radical SAM protein [Geobacteraceae bacterium GWC2_58_44]HBG04111.1 B12-binding domain-containing radical SAM protein [Geobacter sp.]